MPSIAARRPGRQATATSTSALLSALVSLLLATALVATAAPGANAAPAPVPDTGPESESASGPLVALGDSYSSGFGVRPYFPGTSGIGTPNNCQRSPRAFPALVADQRDLELGFHACQGAVTADLFAPRNDTWGELAQLDYLTGDAAIVTVGIGGNDAGFADTLTACIIEALLPFNTCYRDSYVVDPVEAALARLDGQTATPESIVPYDTIFAEVRARSPQSTAVAVGYPPLFRPEGGGLFGRCEGITRPDQRWIVEKTNELNGIMAQHASANGLLFVEQDFAGHELCGELGNDEEWLYPLLSLGLFHPNVAGHEAMAGSLQATLVAAADPRARGGIGDQTHGAGGESGAPVEAGSENERPVAAPAVRVEAGEIVLDASGSADPDGTVEAHEWYVTTARDSVLRDGAVVRLPLDGAERTFTLVVTDDGGLTDFAELRWLPSRAEARDGVVSVAVLSTVTLDATTLDATTVRVGPARATGSSRIADADGDGRADLVLDVPAGEVDLSGEIADGLVAGGELCLEGLLPDGESFVSCTPLRT